MVLSQPQNQHVTKAFALSGKVAVVTGMWYIHNCYLALTCNPGGARGIGHEVSRGLAEAGADVYPFAIQFNSYTAILTDPGSYNLQHIQHSRRDSRRNRIDEQGHRARIPSQRIQQGPDREHNCPDQERLWETRYRRCQLGHRILRPG